MKNINWKKLAAKIGLGAAFALAYGYGMKTEKKLENKLDEHFDEKTEDTEDESAES